MGKYLDGAGWKSKTAERAFPHVASSYSGLAEGWLPDVLCNVAENLGEEGGGKGAATTVMECGLDFLEYKKNSGNPAWDTVSLYTN